MSPPDVAQVAPSLGLRTLSLARAALAAGVREERPNRGAVVDGYLLRCVRHGRRLWTRPEQLGEPGPAWCAAAASAWVWQAFEAIALERDPEVLLVVPEVWGAATRSADEPPFGRRCSVAELVEDAMATGAWRDVQAAEEPMLGDLLVMGRDGHDPRRGGTGHVGAIDEAAFDGWWIISGNDGDAVRRSHRSMSDTVEPIVGWIVLR